MDKKELQEKYDIKIWNEEKIKSFQDTLLDWYDHNKRDLPWRQTNDPYKIWISEIMLQQTQVDTVIPYYKNFLDKFPTIKDLAQAPTDDVLKAWQGLGYYSRARNLQDAAKQIMLHYDGEFPKDPKEIIKLKGIGPYTMGAIASIAFNHPQPAVDGNLMRVISRLFEIDLDIANQKHRKVFESVACHLISKDRPGDFNQALMDIGASISTPKFYDAQNSPIKAFDQAFINDTWRDYPVKKPKKKVKNVSYLALVITNENNDYLLEKRPEKGLLANMWTFPLIEIDKLESSSQLSFTSVELLEEDQLKLMKSYVKDNYHISTDINRMKKGHISHVFSHLKWLVDTFEGNLQDPNDTSEIPDQCQWVKSQNFDTLVFPKLQEKIWEDYKKISLF